MKIIPHQIFMKEIDKEKWKEYWKNKKTKKSKEIKKSNKTIIKSEKGKNKENDYKK